MVTGKELEIFRHSLQGIVEEMGLTLERTSYSTNIKIRRDYSCALFDDQLRHISQFTAAPAQIAAILYATPPIIEERADELEPGDGFLVNDPSEGGSVHLPDVMLISPVFLGDEVIGYVANDAHHVDIGGGTPGGVPTDSTDLYGEGLILPGIKAVRDWQYDEELLRLILRNIRGREMRLGDYHAQLGCNRIGAKRFETLVDEYGSDAIGEHLDEFLDYSERRVRAAIEELPDGTYQAEDHMDGDGVEDDPVQLKLTVEVDGDEITFDFTGTAPQNKGPLNSTPSTVFAGTMVAILSLLGGDLPVNDGFYRAFELVTPKGTMVNPRPNAPIAGTGEIAMRTSELVVKALAEVLPDRVIAGTKGTIINVAYGGSDPRDDGEYVYYETYAGGYGGRPTKDGIDAVQPYLQNTANSPIEELETEIPLYVQEYSLREGSEGPGKYRGGLGLRRDMEFYDHEASFTVLADRSKFPPWGLFGGRPASTARYVINPDGESEEVSSKSTTRLSAGDVASIQTPGGGGYGDPFDRDPDAVLQDVTNGKISIERAREEYGVVIDPESNTIDRPATRNLR